MDNLTAIEGLLSQRFFAEAAYFAGVAAAESPTARAHVLAGVACCGAATPLASAQRLLEGDDAQPTRDAGCRVSPATELPYAGFEHLVDALRLEPQLRAPEQLRDVFDEVADDLAYILSRRSEIQRLMFVAAEAGDVRRNLRQTVHPTQPGQLLRSAPSMWRTRSVLCRARRRRQREACCRSPRGTPDAPQRMNRRWRTLSPVKSQPQGAGA